MQLVTWNLNSLKVRLPHVLDWLVAQQPDVVCLQETKLDDPFFPAAAFHAAGYHASYSGQKTYNGVAILSKAAAHETVNAIPDWVDPQKRVLAATIEGVRIVCVYAPNGQSVGSDKYDYKLRWLAALHHWLQTELARYPRLALLGDFNIAPQARDVYDAAAWEGKILCSPPERAALQALLGLELKDSFRLFPQEDASYSWWDYRMNAFRRNLGLRIDHILLSAPLAKHCIACRIDKAPRRLERPSDHAPVIAVLDIPS
ncbi:MAG TPA: exodeoxyribonuclease III [Betaproteobacteria bacterium]|nr:exodeoxyribonuclease III [Betaproteobacteria bacterium]